MVLFIMAKELMKLLQPSFKHDGYNGMIKLKNEDGVS